MENGNGAEMKLSMQMEVSACASNMWFYSLKLTDIGRIAIKKLTSLRKTFNVMEQHFAFNARSRIF